MNDILYLKGTFEQKSRTFKGASIKIYREVNSNQMNNLYNDLQQVIAFWKNENLLQGTLISVYYKKIVAKSNRICALLSNKGKTSNASIVGSKFAKEGHKHIITHYVPVSVLYQSLEYIQTAKTILDNEFNGIIDVKTFENKDVYKHIDFSSYGISKTKFQQIIHDVSYVEKFGIEQNTFTSHKGAIITIYDVQTDTLELFNNIGISLSRNNILDNTTMYLNENEVNILVQKAPYLISMACVDYSTLSPQIFKKIEPNTIIDIPSPTIEPVIGVIDTLFDETVYFSEWVEYHNMLDKNIPIIPKDYDHGTAVSSIIVDGGHINPGLDDGCGRFRVRHFGVATDSHFSSFNIIRQIKDIVAQNTDIKVWNLSLGSNDEINDNFISAEAAVLDQIQFEYDVIFVVAATNKNNGNPEKKIGAPADSINSLVVSSVDFDNKPTTYSCKGLVLSFFIKPDVSYYGGSQNHGITVCKPLGRDEVVGTSFAAPWIARKLCYLIEILGFNKEIAKALIVDSAIGWNQHQSLEDLSYMGNGVVPIRIEDIVQSENDEIKFVLSGISEKYDTFNYNFPVPIYKDKFPYIAKATLCYFPKCSRNQGVDYTNTELDIYFGNINNRGKINSLNYNKQSIDDVTDYTLEEDARKIFRKWDNVKHISNDLKPNLRGKKVYTNKMWSMSIKTKERSNIKDGVGIRFGVVVTLKEINGVNRIEDFIQQCSLRNWLVQRINIENRIDIYETASEDIEWD